jgi:Domain of unknown function (DUF4919)
MSWWTAFGAEADDITYRTLLERAKGGDFTVDFRALRLACMKASHCEPRGSRADLTAMSAEDPHKVVEVAEKLIEDGFVNLEAHATAAGAYAKLNDSEKAKAHFAITLELLRSIMATRDGKTKESAYEVICDREEYSVLSALGLPYLPPAASMTPVKDGTHSYERWRVQNPKTGQDVVLYFNIDAFIPAKSRVRDK